MDLSLNLLSPTDVLGDIAARARRRRLDIDMTQAALARRTGLSVGTIKNFERDGEANLRVVVLIGFALGVEDGFAALFPPAPPRGIDDVLERPRRRRARGA